MRYRDFPKEEHAMDESEFEGAEHYLPEERTHEALNEAGEQCRGCNLHEGADNFVMGEGTADASLMVVGGSPGDQEDAHGAPFVGEAGERLDRALADAGLDREEIYLSTAVKHVRRKEGEVVDPEGAQIDACRPWLEAEIANLQPDCIAALGGVAARSILGESVDLTESAGDMFRSKDGPVVVTFDPARTAVEEEGEKFRALVEALRTAHRESQREESFGSGAGRRPGG
jgi:DNA polymerase